MKREGFAEVLELRGQEPNELGAFHQIAGDRFFLKLFWKLGGPPGAFTRGAMESERERPGCGASAAGP